MTKRSNIAKDVANIAYHLERLKQEKFLETQRAILKKDEELLKSVCKNIKVPDKYVPSIVKALMGYRRVI